MVAQRALPSGLAGQKPWHALMAYWPVRGNDDIGGLRPQLAFKRVVLNTARNVMLLLGLTTTIASGSPSVLIIDDRSSNTLISSIGSAWRFITDGVMGGLSKGMLRPDTLAERACLRLRGDVTLENNGGFIQMALDLGGQRGIDFSSYTGLELSVYGNGEHYNVHLRTGDLSLPWQSYRSTFVALPDWQTLRLAFAAFTPHRTSTPLDLSKLTRIGLVAIGRTFHADVCLGSVALYREPAVQQSPGIA